MRRIRNWVRNLITCTSGTALIEAGIVAPVLIAGVMGIVDVSRFAAAKFEVQQGINRGLELAMMSGPSASTTSIQSEASAQTGIPAANITVTQTQTCAGVAATWGASCATGQETQKFIQIQVTSSFTPTFVGGYFAKLYGNTSGVVTLDARGEIRVQ